MNNMPPVVKNLLIINVLAYVAKIVLLRYGIDFDDLLGLHFFKATDFRLYQFITYLFVHGSFTHLFFNMFAVWMFGRLMEGVMGSQRFLLFYMVCGIGAGLMQEGVQTIEFYMQGLNTYDSVNLSGAIVSMNAYLNHWTTIGASGAVYGVLLSFGMTFPEERMFVFPIPFPIKAKWFVIGYAVIELLSAMGNRGDGVAHMAHLGGMLFGFLLIMYWRRHDNDNNRFYGGGGSFGGFDNYFTQYEDITNDDTSSRKPSLRARFSEWLAKRRRSRMKVNTSASKHASDMDWNYEKKTKNTEIDKILDKIKKGGYESLTKEEKQKLFDASKQ